MTAEQESENARNGRDEIEEGKEEEAHVVKCDVERAKCGENPWKLITIRARFTDAVSLSASSLTFVERLLATRSRPICRNISRSNFHGNTETFAPLASDGNRKSFGARVRLAFASDQPREEEEEKKKKARRFSKKMLNEYREKGGDSKREGLRLIESEKGGLEFRGEGTFLLFQGG